MLERELLKSANRRLRRSTMGAWAMLYGVSLICVLDLGQQSVVEEPSCGPGRVQNGTGTNTRCCSLCAPGKEECLKERCICVTPEYHCEDPWCKTCIHYPCQPGQRVESQGIIKFGFQCVDCTMGTFSAGREGHCRLWTNFTTETQPLLEVQLPPAEDACSFQFPEEERGEQTEEKCRLGDRWP
uniref:tumor necrosis factor receptor superfamily member 18 isoform X3 n=1 Tax=Arvicanthis niloticus TaxID=61156 RepID=UPI00402BDA05